MMNTSQHKTQQLTTIHCEILRRLVLCQNPRDIAQELCVSYQTVSNVRNSSAGIAIAEQMQSVLDELTIKCGVPWRDENGITHFGGIDAYMEQRESAVDDVLERVRSGEKVPVRELRKVATHSIETIKRILNYG